MRRKTVCILLVIAALLMTVPCYAGLARSSGITPTLSFSGTKATCSVSVIADNSTDRISVDLVLKRGSTTIDSWFATDLGELHYSDIATVARGYTYTLEVTVYVNGVLEDYVTVTKSNS